MPQCRDVWAQCTRARLGTNTHTHTHTHTHTWQLPWGNQQGMPQLHLGHLKPDTYTRLAANAFEEGIKGEEV